MACACDVLWKANLDLTLVFNSLGSLSVLLVFLLRGSQALRNMSTLAINSEATSFDLGS